MKKVLETFKDDVYFEYRHLPLPHHPFSKQFSIASVCAGDQNQFFEFIGLSFANQKSFSKIKPVELAEKLNLDIDAFNRCLVSPMASQVIDVDINEADRLKVKATPTFYINGHYFSGIPSVEDIKSFL